MDLRGQAAVTASERLQRILARRLVTVIEPQAVVAGAAAAADNGALTSPADDDALEAQATNRLASRQEAIDATVEMMPSVTHQLMAPPSAPLVTAAAPAAAALDDDTYFDAKALLASVESGAIAPLRGRWLVELHKQGGRLRRRQDLPSEAFWTAAELRDAATKLGDDFGVLFVALSYRWLSRSHPDPDGFHLGLVASVAELYLNLAGRGDGTEYPSQLTQAFQSRGLGEADFALFWDFASLHQAPRTDPETACFKQGLKLSNVWYGHSRSVVWMQSMLPDGFQGATYDLSGWCFVEAAISAAIKPGFQRLDLALRTKTAMECAYGPEKPGNSEYKLACVCARKRLPPPSPEMVAALLQTEKKFTNSADIGQVAALYAAFFAKVTSVRSLDFRGLGWEDAEANALAAVLPRFGALTSLDVSQNRLGQTAAKALAPGIIDGDIKMVDLSGLRALADSLAVMPSLTSVRWPPAHEPLSASAPPSHAA